MGKIYSKALNETINAERLIGSVNGKNKGPTLIFTGGIHGNEPAGVFALKEFIGELENLQDKLSGNVYAVSGNLWALEREERFDKQDLNRLWTKERMEKILAGKHAELEHDEDTKQQLEIYYLLLDIIEKEEGPFFFLDLHTTSGPTMPFLTVNDTLLNRRFSLQYPVPIILGIEEFLDGPLLSFINYLGYIAIGFESGQHDEVSSIENHFAFSYISLVMTGCINKVDLPNFNKYYNLLAGYTINSQSIFEIIYRHEIKDGDEFKMNPGFTNFQNLTKGTELALSNKIEIRSDRKGRIFMPLYQNQGNDGYFIVRKTPYFFLKFSAFLRRIKFDRVIAILPGVRWGSKNKKTLIIKRNIARFFAKDFFHLLGYRSRMMDDKYMYAKNRESQSLKKDYKDIKWFR